MKMMNRIGVRRRVLAVAATSLMAPLACMSVASTTAALAAPKGIFAKFAQCPTSVPGVTFCQYVEVTSGEMAIGPLKIPVGRPVIFQGGTLPAGRINLYFLLPAANGESISATEQDVPGGLQSIIGCDRVKGKDDRALRRWDPCRGLYRGRGHDDKVTLTLEGVANPGNPAILDLAAIGLEEGTGLTFPGRIHLKNPLLGEECHIGSEAHPIELRFTDGTTNPPPPNEPIKGTDGTTFEEEENGLSLVVTTGNSLVDNAFSVPPAEGCGGRLSSLIDSRIDQTLGLESPAGHNTAILNGTHRIAAAEAVLASEKFPTKEENPPPPHHHHHHHRWWLTH